MAVAMVEEEALGLSISGYMFMQGKLSTSKITLLAVSFGSN